jgi:hypothetical protein
MSDYQGVLAVHVWQVSTLFNVQQADTRTN